ncbi:MAG: Ldh family oxidoreductase [Proteobacteria bacterium]|jgi:uncharacterized oxidoreductase|nr:Ldh family oxidoreductase [Pseudomonadota bacterium]
MDNKSKLILSESRVNVSLDDVREKSLSILIKAGCKKDYANKIIDHLIDSDLSGVESHGVVRTLQYLDEYQQGYLLPNVVPKLTKDSLTTINVDGQGGLGIPAIDMATEEGIAVAKSNGMCAVAIRNIGHTGRLGAFAEKAANRGFLFILCGGGARDKWRMVAPYGGKKALLPTNPWCLGIPGGLRGPVVLDCATSKIAGGWIKAARIANAKLPKGMIIDKNGLPTDNPNDFFSGGAILPKGEALGYGLATIGELICDAMLGPATVECNTLILLVDTTRYRHPDIFKNAAEEILSELRDCPPAKGFERVEIPGEREQKNREISKTIMLPKKIWAAIQKSSI